MITRKVYGKPFRACHQACAEGFKTDRRYGAIYSATFEVDEDNKPTGRWWNPEEASVEFNQCVYCGVTS